MKSTDDLSNTKKKLEEISPSFCLAKWKNSTLHLYNGHTQSCHHVPSHKIGDTHNSPLKLHNTSNKMASREQMLKGGQPSECEYCWKVERAGQTSDRIHKSSENVYMDYFSEVVESGSGPNINPSFLEVAFENTCQFRCMYCSPAYSSHWQKEVEQFGDYKTTGNLVKGRYNQSRLPLPKEQQEAYRQQFWSWWPSLKKDLQYMRVTGGEPLLSSHLYKLMDDLIADPQHHLHFALNTNFGFSSSQTQNFLKKLPELQKSCKEVLLFTSLDNVGPQAEYIRYGLKESDFWDNIEVALNMAEENFVLCFMVTTNVLSVSGLLPLLKKIETLKQTWPHVKIQLDVSYLRAPQHLSIEILTPEFRPYIEEAVTWAQKNSSFSPSEIQKIERLRDLVSNSQKNRALLFLLRQDFARFMQEYDRRKGTDFAGTFPEYENFMKLCSSGAKNFSDSFLAKRI